MRRHIRISGLICSLLVIAPLAVGVAQGKGQGKRQDKGQGQGREVKGREAKGRDPVRRNEPAAPKRPKEFINEFGGEVEPSRIRPPAVMKHGRRIARGAVERAASRRIARDAFLITPAANRVRVFNRNGALLLDLDDDRDIGSWRVVTEPDRAKGGTPSFCRSGSGHPVWGRQWCIEKGFGLGRDGDFRWARGIDFDNVIFRRPITATELLTRELLLGVLGDNAFNRLAAHAVSLGLVEPLAGRWMGESTGPRVLLVSSGARPVAELVDVNRDDRAEMLVVAIRP